jgi:hypothetical protein
MPLQLSHGIVVIRFQRQISILGIALEERSFLQESGYTVTDGMDQRFELIDVGRFYPVKAQAPIVIFHIHAVEKAVSLKAATSCGEVDCKAR